MSITLELPDHVERRLRESSHDLERDVLQAVAINLFRASKISTYEFGQMLGFDRWESEQFLAERGILEQTLTLEDLEDDYRTMQSLRRKTAS